MIIDDNETFVDLLYYNAIAKTLVVLVLETGQSPVTVGVHGDWGAGKSSVLAMAEQEFKADKDIICLRFNGWQFQGFEDAKAALIETIITELRDARPAVECLKEKAMDVLKRVDYLKLAKKGLGWAFSIGTGIPNPSQVKDAVGLLHGVVEAAKIGLTPDLATKVLQAEGMLKPGTEKKLPEEMRAFQKDFEELIQMAKIKKLVVLIDDLDRCLPATAIETLEAIRLFLFAPKTAFVIAADEAMIEYAVKQHFPDLQLALSSGPVTYARSYLEKLVQVPFRIPALGYVETQIYVAMALLQAELGSDASVFRKLQAQALEMLSRPWKRVKLDLPSAREAIGDCDPKTRTIVDQAITLSEQVSSILTDGTKGNPRQVKRFLNSMDLRYRIAEARGFAADIKRPALAKIMLVESFAPQFYDQLTKATFSSGDGCPRELTVLENAVRIEAPADTELGADTGKNPWADDEWVRNWAKIDPPLKQIDLRPYMFVTRDKRSFFGGPVAGGQLEAIVQALTGKGLAVATVGPYLSKLNPVEAEQVFDAVQGKIMQDEDFRGRPEGLIAVTKAHPKLQKKLFAFINGISIKQLGTWACIGFDKVFTDPAVGEEYKAMRKKWGEQKENPDLARAVTAFSKQRTGQPKKQ